MKDWNVVVSLNEPRSFRRAIHGLKDYGHVEKTGYYNVLVLNVDDTKAFLGALEQRCRDEPSLYDAISRVAPAHRTFEFRSPGDFKLKAEAAIGEFLPRLAGRSFHVRFHHRRPAGQGLGTQEVERSIGESILAALQQEGCPGKLSFDDPDAVLAIDTVDDRAGVALWTREDLERHRLLRPD
jgi:tRNA(Ser,Leu) C12 N-acetylase TAN1